MAPYYLKISVLRNKKTTSKDRRKYKSYKNCTWIISKRFGLFF